MQLLSQKPRKMGLFCEAHPLLQYTPRKTQYSSFVGFCCRWVSIDFNSCLSGLLRWQWCNLTSVPLPVQQPWRMCIYVWNKYTRTYYIILANQTQQRTVYIVLVNQPFILKLTWSMSRGSSLVKYLFTIIIIRHQIYKFDLGYAVTHVRHS